VGTQRSLSSRVIGVHSLPTAIIALIQEQAGVRGLVHDPLPDVTHGLRTDEVTRRARWFGGTRTARRFVELLLTPDLLIVVERAPGDGTAPAPRVDFHRLSQLRIGAGPSEPEHATGTPEQPGLALVSTPVGATERAARVVPLDEGPEATRFREALIAARNGPGGDAPAGGFAVHLSRTADDASTAWPAGPAYSELS
jgi:hypothetical protein